MRSDRYLRLRPHGGATVSGTISEMVITACILLTFGCDQGFEFETPGSSETEPSSPMGQSQGSRLDSTKAVAPALPAKPKRTTAEIIADFEQLEPHKITDFALGELAALDEAVAQFEAIDCTSSGMTDAGLKEVVKLTNLVELKIDNTPISAQGIQEIAKLPHLQTLSMQGLPNSVETLTSIDAGVETLVEMENLTDLDLSRSRLDNAGYAAIGKIVSLKRLALNETQLTDSGLAMLSGLVNLEVLEISGTAITDNGFASLRPLTKLHTLKMADTRINGTGFAELSKSRKRNGLRVVDASLTEFGSFGFLGLVGSQSLEVLYVGRAAVTDSSLVGLKRCKNLRELRLSYNPGVTTLGIRNLAGLKNLEELLLHGLPSVADNALGFLKSHKNLRLLGLNGSACSLNGVQRLKQLLPELKIAYMGKEL